MFIPQNPNRRAGQPRGGLSEFVSAATARRGFTTPLDLLQSRWRSTCKSTKFRSSARSKPGRRFRNERSSRKRTLQDTCRSDVASAGPLVHLGGWQGRSSIDSPRYESSAEQQEVSSFVRLCRSSSRVKAISSDTCGATLLDREADYRLCPEPAPKRRPARPASVKRRKHLIERSKKSADANGGGSKRPADSDPPPALLNAFKPPNFRYVLALPSAPCRRPSAAQLSTACTRVRVASAR